MESQLIVGTFQVRLGNSRLTFIVLACESKWTNEKKNEEVNSPDFNFSWLYFHLLHFTIYAEIKYLIVCAQKLFAYK